jgi:hypothetical protein
MDRHQQSLDRAERNGFAVDRDRGFDSRVRGNSTRPQLGFCGAVALKGAALRCSRGAENPRTGLDGARKRTTAERRNDIAPEHEALGAAAAERIIGRRRLEGRRP